MHAAESNLRTVCVSSLQVAEKPMRRGVLPKLVLPTEEGPAGDKKTRGGLECSSCKATSRNDARVLEGAEFLLLKDLIGGVR